MKVEFVGIGETHAYKHEAASDLKKLAKQISSETNVKTDISGDNLIVAGSTVPVGMVAVVRNGGVSTLSSEAFSAQYREILDIDSTDFEKRLAKLEAAAKPKAAPKVEPKAEDKK